jgi:hypothetical protein
MNNPRSNPSIGDKTVTSFLITPAIPASIFSTYSLIDNPRSSMLTIGILFVFVYLVASAHSFLLGIPVFLLFKRLNTIHWWTCILGAFLIGGLPIALWRAWSESAAWRLFGASGWPESVMWGLLGASGGFGFWLLWQFWIHSD